MVFTRSVRIISFGSILRDMHCERGSKQPDPYALDWRWWPLAKSKGVKTSINPDAHHTTQLQFLKFGVGTARKGWLTRHDVVNTLPLGKIEAVLGKKR